MFIATFLEQLNSGRWVLASKAREDEYDRGCLFFMFPALIEQLVERHIFPKDFENWDRIGLFDLRDGDKNRLVLLYQHGSNLVGMRSLKKEGIGGFIYPNQFSLHAVHQDANGKWVHIELLSGSRIGFEKIKKISPDLVVLEFRTRCMVDVDQEGSSAKALKNAEEINKPFTRSLSFEKGKLFILK